MLIILGIVVLAVSFVIALISLVVEERKREKLIAEQEDVPSVAEKTQVSVAPPAEVISPRAPLKKEVPEEVAAGDVLPEEAQPWYQELTSTQVHSEEKVPENVQAEEEIHPRDARLPSLGPQSSLSGEIKIGDISKKRE